MKATAASARSLAAHAVARILREGVTLDAALKDALAAADPKLAPSVRSLSYGAVRGYYRHEAILRSVLSAPVRSLDLLVRALLSVALYELEDARTPEYAVVDAAVQTAKATDAVRAAGLINAVLRRYLRERKNLDADIARNPATRHASPVWLADRLRAATPEGETCSIGIACWDGQESAPTLLGRADGALYDAKRAGRNLSVIV